MARGVPAAVSGAVERVRHLLERAQERWQTVQDGMTPRQERLYEGVRFLAVFTVLAAPLYLVVDSGWEAYGLRTVNAAVSAAVLNLAGLPATSSGPFLSVGELLVDVTRDSTGWKSVLAFAALVLATRRPRRSKLYGLAAGIAIILGANVARITSTVYAVHVLSVDYELLHTVLWRWGLTAVVFTAWIVWLRPRSLVRMVER